MAKKLTSNKAKKILHDKSVHGKPLTDKQRRFFGAIAGGAEPYKAESGGWLDKYIPKAQNGIEGTMGGLTDKGFNYNGAWGGTMQTGGNLMPAMAGAVQTVPMAQLGDSVKPITMQLAMGGSLPGAVGFTYARTIDAAPANGPYAKKTKASAQDGKKLSYSQWKKQYNLKETPDYNLKRAWELGYTPDKTGHLPTVDNQTGQFLKAKGHPTLQLELDWYNSPEAADFRSKNVIDSSGKFFRYVPRAQNGQEMKYYQEGLDFKPKTISKNGGWLDKYEAQDGGDIPVDPMGYWNPENIGNPVIIPSNVITMEGVDQPLIGISDTGDVQYMEPGEDYEFEGESVLEMPVAQKGVTQPSRADSIILLKNAIAKDLFYNNPNYRAINHDRNPTLLTRKGLQELARESVKYNTDPYFRNNPDMIVGGQEDDPTRFIVKAKDLIKKTGRVKGSNIIYQAPDVITGVDTYFNPAAPPNYFSPQILPQGVKTYYSDKYRDRASAPYYEPLAVTPWDMLTEKQKDLRLKKYGVTGTPYANRNKGPKKQWSLNPLVPSFERTPISIMQPNLTPGPIPTIERPVIEIPQEVPVQEEAPTTKKGKAEREKKTPVRDFLQELKWKMEDRKMRRQTERGTKRQLRCWSGVCFDDEGNIAEAEYGGYLPKAQNGKRVPIVVSDPKDPRLKAYNDSLYTYKKGFELAGKLGSIFDKEYGYDKTTKEYKKRLQNLYEGKTGKYTWNTPSAGRMSDKEIQKEINYYDKLNNYEKQVASVLKEYLKLPVKNFTASYSPELPTVLRYKKPVQPVEYEAPQRDTLYVSDPNDPRLRAYSDSLSLYNTNIWPKNKEKIKNRIVPKQAYTIVGKNKEGEDVWGLRPYKPLAIEPAFEYDFIDNTQVGKESVFENIGRGKAGNLSTMMLYKKPVQPVVYERPAPQMSPVFMDRRQIQPMSPNLTATPISQVNRPRGGYMVQYKDIDESGKLVPKQMYFQTPQQADDYMQARIKAGIMYGGSMQRSGVDINRGPFEFGGEIPVAKQGVSVNNADAQPLKKLDQLLNFTNYNKPTRGGWLDKYK